MLGRDHTEYECWTLLSAVAGFTSDVNIGSLVLSNDYRNFQFWFTDYPDTDGMELFADEVMPSFQS